MVISDLAKKRITAIIALGICEALKNNSIDFDEAERLLFSPHAHSVLGNLSPQCRDLIAIGMELHDIYEIVPREYDSSLQAIAEHARTMLVTEAPCDIQEGPWFTLL